MKKIPRLRPEKERKDMCIDCSEKIPSPGKIDRIILAVSTAASSLFLTTGITFAEDIVDKVDEVLGVTYGQLAGLSTGIYALVALICFICVQTGGDDTAKAWTRRFKRATICWIAILCFGAIVAYGEDLFSGMGYGD
ncbi:hypothetical protein AALA24_09880 [Anaerovoracaceae bacterium 42-11]